jgi:hypothetical protein
MVITVVIPAAAAAWTAGADINLLEDLSGATQTTRNQVHTLSAGSVRVVQEQLNTAHTSRVELAAVPVTPGTGKLTAALTHH